MHQGRILGRLLQVPMYLARCGEHTLNASGRRGRGEILHDHFAECRPFVCLHLPPSQDGVVQPWDVSIGEILLKLVQLWCGWCSDLLFELAAKQRAEAHFALLGERLKLRRGRGRGRGCGRSRRLTSTHRLGIELSQIIMDVLLAQI